MRTSQISTVADLRARPLVEFELEFISDHLIHHPRWDSLVTLGFVGLLWVYYALKQSPNPIVRV